MEKTIPQLLCEWGEVTENKRELLRKLEEINTALMFTNKQAAALALELNQRGYAVSLK